MGLSTTVYNGPNSKWQCTHNNSCRDTQSFSSAPSEISLVTSFFPNSTLRCQVAPRLSTANLWRRHKVWVHNALWVGHKVGWGSIESQHAREGAKSDFTALSAIINILKLYIKQPFTDFRSVTFCCSGCVMEKQGHTWMYMNETY